MHTHWDHICGVFAHQNMRYAQEQSESTECLKYTRKSEPGGKDLNYFSGHYEMCLAKNFTITFGPPKKSFSACQCLFIPSSGFPSVPLPLDLFNWKMNCLGPVCILIQKLSVDDTFLDPL